MAVAGDAGSGSRAVISHGTDRQTVFVSATIPQKNHFLKQCVQNQWTVREPFYVCASPGELIPPTLKHVYVVCDGMDQKMVGLIRVIHREIMAKEGLWNRNTEVAKVQQQQKQQKQQQKQQQVQETSSHGSDCVRIIVFCEPQRPMEKMKDILQRELSKRIMVDSSDYNNNVVMTTSVLRYHDSTSTRVAAMETFRGSDTYLGGRIMEEEGVVLDDNADNGDLEMKTVKDEIKSPKKQRNLNILITSDLAARGLDIADITHVINYDLPHESDTYVHRGGRAGRLGRKGMVISIITNEQEFVLDRLANKLGLDMKCISRQRKSKDK
jgi:superfamily II DNA/RNA helicase